MEVRAGKLEVIKDNLKLNFPISHDVSSFKYTNEIL